MIGLMVSGQWDSTPYDVQCLTMAAKGKASFLRSFARGRRELRSTAPGIDARRYGQTSGA